MPSNHWHLLIKLIQGKDMGFHGSDPNELLQYGLQFPPPVAIVLRDTIQMRRCTPGLFGDWQPLPKDRT